jgi:hypothetical protein
MGQVENFISKREQETLELVIKILLLEEEVELLLVQEVKEILPKR